MADRIENKANIKTAPESTAGSLIHGVMDHLKNKYDTLNDSNAGMTERAVAVAELMAEGVVASAASYGLTRFGLGRLFGRASVTGEMSATERLLASSTPINPATREAARDALSSGNIYERYFQSEGFKARMADPSIDKMILQPHEVAHDLSVPKLDRLR